KWPVKWLADEHPRADPDHARQLFDLLVGQGDAAPGPVETVVDERIAAADAMDANVSAQGSVLRRHPTGVVSADEGFMGTGIDQPQLPGTLHVHPGRIVQAEEDM